jgi:alpha-D-xyloside xylohydrolase
MDKALFQIGADAWWLDTTEPETEGREENLMLNNKLAIGSGARYANIFPLMTTTAVYDGQRKASDRKRVFHPLAFGFAGAQRNAVTAWSGDILSDFETYKRQIPAGLNFSLSGIPYWTTDIGGFFIGNPNDPAYRELFVRWFQYGTFCPIFRVHGTRTTNQNELWSYGPEAQSILTKFDRLRYELMPYIYSVAWMTTSESYTPMRPLVMDFRSDVRAQNIGDQFLFGPAILVNPVTEPGAPRGTCICRRPNGTTSGPDTPRMAAKSIDAPATLDRLPLYVRAGSIVPMGPDVEYATEKPADPIELRVYRGADGSFTLYEDENDSYDYEKGAYATIPMHWDEGARSLTIGERKGQFPGMLETRTFRVVFVGEGHGAGIGQTAQPDKVVQYSREAQSVGNLGSRQHCPQTACPIVCVMHVLPASGFGGCSHKLGEQEQLARLNAVGRQALRIHRADPDVGAQRNVRQGAGPLLHPAGWEAGREHHQNALARRRRQVSHYHAERVQRAGGLILILLPHVRGGALDHPSRLDAASR